MIFREFEKALCLAIHTGKFGDEPYVSLAAHVQGFHETAKGHLELAMRRLQERMQSSSLFGEATYTVTRGENIPGLGSYSGSAGTREANGPTYIKVSTPGSCSYDIAGGIIAVASKKNVVIAKAKRVMIGDAATGFTTVDTIMVPHSLTGTVKWADNEKHPEVLLAAFSAFAESLGAKDLSEQSATAAADMISKRIALQFKSATPGRPGGLGA